MKLLLTGDWHLRFKRPRMRLDENYFETQYGKIKQLLDLADRNGCGIILQPGDFFDGIDVPWFVVNKYIELLGSSYIQILCIRGQHDLRYHSQRIDNTPLAVMEAAEIVQVLKQKPYRLTTKTGMQIGQVYGCSWGEDIPEVKDKKELNILVIHEMIVDKKIWKSQEDFVYGKSLLDEYPEFDLFVCGDNHKSFSFNVKDRYLVNCGSLMRSGIDQVDHRPCYYIYDTDDRTIKQKFLRVGSKTKILNVGQARKEKERNEELDLFVLGLDEQKDLGLNFLDNLKRKVKSLDFGIRNVIKEASGKGERFLDV